MNIKLNAIFLGGLLALTPFLAQPVRADEWNKKTEFTFSGPVEIPGKMLAAGKYVFQLVDSDSDRNIVRVFSEDANGKDTLVATILAIPDYILETPDKPVIRFDERQAGAPEAIHSWFYPGENTGWQFVYPKIQPAETNAGVTPAQAPVETAAAPSVPQAPDVKESEPTAKEVSALEEEILIAPDEEAAPPALSPTPEADAQGNSSDRVLPETSGHSGLELLTGLAMLGAGTIIVLASQRGKRLRLPIAR